MKTLNDIEKISFEHPVMFFDGECIFCSRALQFFIRIDKDELIRYTTLQSDEGQLVMKNLNISDDMDSVALIDKGDYYVKSDVTFQLLGQMKYPWKILSVIKILPRSFRDFFYDIIAKNRYKIFGKSDHCIIPSVDQKHLFLNT